MIIENKKFLLGIAILDDLPEPRNEIKGMISYAFEKQYGKNIKSHLLFFPEDWFEATRKKSYRMAKDFLENQDNIRKIDLIIIDINWVEGSGSENVSGVRLAEKVAEEPDIVKMVYTAFENGEPKEAIRRDMKDDINIHGKRFFRSIEKLSDEWNLEMFKDLTRYTMDVFREKRDQFIKKECANQEIIQLIKKDKVEGNDKIKINGWEGRLRDIFFECQSSDEYKEELSRCYDAQNRFVIMRNLYYKIDAVYKPTHLDETHHQEKLTELFLENKILEEFLFPSQKKYFEEFQKYLKDEPEDKLVLEFFSKLKEKIYKCLSVCSSVISDVQKQKKVKHTIEELERLGRRFRIQTRVDDLKELGCLFKGIQTEKLNSKIINNLFCFWGDINEKRVNAHLLNLKEKIPPVTETIEDGGIKEELEIIWNALDRKNREVQKTDRDFDAWIEIKGRLASSKIRQYDEGGFDLKNKSLKKCIDEGTSFKKLKNLIPAYFTPFVIESNGRNHGWHSVSVSCFEGVKKISPEEFKKNTDGFTESLVEKNIFGVRFLLKYPRILTKIE